MHLPPVNSVSAVQILPWPLHAYILPPFTQQHKHDTHPTHIYTPTLASDISPRTSQDTSLATSTRSQPAAIYGSFARTHLTPPLSPLLTAHCKPLTEGCLRNHVPLGHVFSLNTNIMICLFIYVIKPCHRQKCLFTPSSPILHFAKR